MSLIEEIKPYIDQYGLVQYKPGEGSGNGLLITSLYLICLKLRQDPLSSIEIERVITGPFTACSPVEPGLFERSPGWKSEAMDDYVAICAASYTTAGKVYEYGSKQRPLAYNYNCAEPGKFTLATWLGRMPHFPAHVQMSTRWRKADTWRMPFWFAAVVMGAFAKDGDQDSKLFAWLLLYGAQGYHYSWWKPANWIFQRRLKKQFGSMQAVVAKAIGADHPVAKYWPSDVQTVG